mgnify:CR=1 FL=1
MQTWWLLIIMVGVPVLGFAVAILLKIVRGIRAIAAKIRNVYRCLRKKPAKGQRREPYL